MRLLATSLRLRLILAFAAVGSLMLGVGVSSWFMQRGIRTQVADLRMRTGIDLQTVDLEHVGLELEGYWDPAGSFFATDVEILPGPRRPKLRGPVQAVDSVRRTLTVYGVPIRLDDGTELQGSAGTESGGAAQAALAALAPGDRVEVTCEIRRGAWVASKLQTENVKHSDKIKGTVTSSELDGLAPETLEIQGLPISLAPPVEGPESALRRVELATRMTLALHECRAVAQEVVGRPAATHELDEEREADRDTRLASSAGERLAEVEAELEHHVRQAWGAGEGAASSVADSRWLHELQELLPGLRAHVARLRTLAQEDQSAGRAYLDDVFVPFIEGEVQPLVHALLGRAEERLGDRLRAIVSTTDTTARVVVWTSGVAVLLALVLGLLVWRSIHRPIVALHDAAVRLGQGHLETRVELRSRDEIGVLAEAFNRMAARLAKTTLSISNLETVIDSMAGALVVSDADRRITSVNRAALQLTGHAEDELLGRPFDEVCLPPRPDRSDADRAAETAGDGMLARAERVLRRRGGTEVPVSFSGAELRDRDGVLRGYVCVALDLTERKRIEERLRRSLAEKELLLREVHHRVKNNMQVVSSLLAMQSSSLSDPESIERFENSQNRIRSMALIHEQLYQSADLAEIDLHGYLELLTRHLAESCGLNDGVRLELEVDDFAFDIDRSLACGLIVNELVANSFKHAFPDGAEGTIRIAVRRRNEGECELVVADDGRGLGQKIERVRETLGMSLVETLATQLGGRLHVNGAPGVEVRIVFPLAAGAEVAA